MKSLLFILLSVVTYFLPKIGDNGLTDQDQYTTDNGRICNIATPSMDLYLPDTYQAPYPVLLVCPGGGYQRLAYPNEGQAVAQYMNQRGIAVAVLKYRMPNGHAEIPLADASAAMQMLRDSATTWQLRSHSIGVMGFSAGGHLAASLMTKYPSEKARPDYAVLFYPVISSDKSIWHHGTFAHLLGNNLSAASEWSLDLLTNAHTPACLIVACGDDKTVPVENSIRMYEALQSNQVPAELLLLPKGSHGWGYERTIENHSLIHAAVDGFITAQTNYTPIKSNAKPAKRQGIKVPVIITAGQSNTDGRGYQSNQPRALKQAVGENGVPNILWSYGNPSGWQHTGGLGNLVPFIPASESMTGVSVGRWGYDAMVYLNVAKTLSDDQKLFVIKESAGGSSLATGIYSAGGRRWCVEPTFLDTAGIAGGLQRTASGRGGLALAPALTANIRASIRNIVSQGYIPEIKCILWHQGETDHPEKAAQMYEQNITELIAYLREAIGEIMQEECGVSSKQYKKLPFVMGTIPHSSKQYSALVEQGMYNAAKKDKYIWVVDLQDIPMQDDQLHFNSAGMQTVAERVWNVLTQKRVFLAQ